MTGSTTALYVVCSPCRGVGKTLVSRLLTEFYARDDRPVAAFDLADEAPQLADYLPQFTTTADISDIRGQMEFFDRMIADDGGAKIVDLSYRRFKDFFTVVERIGVFDEARRHSIEPLILFIVDADPRSPQAYANLRRRFTEASLLPVRNRSSDSPASPDAGAPPNSLEIPLLDFSLRAMIDRQAFSFCELGRTDVSDAGDDELRDWVDEVFLQFRDVEFRLGCGQPPKSLAAAPRPRATRRGQPRNVAVPYEVLRFAPKKMTHRQTIALDRTGDATVGMLQEAGRQLRVAEERVDQLEAELERAENRATRAETWLQLVGEEIETKLFEPAAVSRSKIDDLSP